MSSDAGTGGASADQLTLFKPGRADCPHLLLLAPSKCFTFRHHWIYQKLKGTCTLRLARKLLAWTQARRPGSDRPALSRGPAIPAIYLEPKGTALIQTSAFPRTWVFSKFLDFYINLRPSIYARFFTDLKKLAHLDTTYSPDLEVNFRPYIIYSLPYQKNAYL